MLKSTEYTLEVYQPGTTDSVWVQFESSDPFLTITKGDLINPVTWPGSRSPMETLLVTRVEHIIWEIEPVVKHKIMVYTAHVES